MPLPSMQDFFFLSTPSLQTQKQKNLVSGSRCYCGPHTYQQKTLTGEQFQSLFRCWSIKGTARHRSRASNSQTITCCLLANQQCATTPQSILSFSGPDPRPSLRLNLFDARCQGFSPCLVTLEQKLWLNKSPAYSPIKSINYYLFSSIYFFSPVLTQVFEFDWTALKIEPSATSSRLLSVASVCVGVRVFSALIIDPNGVQWQHLIEDCATVTRRKRTRGRHRERRRRYNVRWKMFWPQSSTAVTLATLTKISSERQTNANTQPGLVGRLASEQVALDQLGYGRAPCSVISATSLHKLIDLSGLCSFVTDNFILSGNETLKSDQRIHKDKKSHLNSVLKSSELLWKLVGFFLCAARMYVRRARNM